MFRGHVRVRFLARKTRAGGDRLGFGDARRRCRGLGVGGGEGACWNGFPRHRSGGIGCG